MSLDLNMPIKKKKTKSKMIVRLMLPMMLVVVLQLTTFFAILIGGGEFSYVRNYIYSTLVDTTESRRNYLRSELQETIPIVQEASEKINNLIAEILVEERASISDIQTDKDLNRIIIESSVDSLIDLLRRSGANGVYLILETGDLYSDVGGSSNAKAALYLQDLDSTTNAGYEDLLVEMGYSSISQKFGMVLDSGWSLHFEPDPEDMETFDYYYKTLQTAQENSALAVENLGYWSGFSTLSRSGTASMRYTVPLIAKDGTVYGVIGIGMTENTILSSIPASDFNNVNACYVLGRVKADDQFEIITYSGAAFNWLVGHTKTLQVSGMLGEDVYDFSTDLGFDLAGSIQYINLYGQGSPYYEQQWALISVADRASVLSPLTTLIRVLVIAAVISVTVSIVVIILSSRGVVKPISAAIKTMNSNQEYGQVIRFQPSNIFEIDMMTDAITQQQINVQKFSSQVSQMIRIADVGLGTFMYDRADDSVFVGQSLLKLLRFQTQKDEDVVMSRQEFLANIIAEETRLEVTESLDIVPDDTQTDYVRVYSIAQEDGSTAWMRLSLVHTINKSVGILQDITRVMIEKQRIEYERDYDTTTGLLNRRAYYRRVQELFRDTDALKTAAFLMIDLDNLKYVNDTYGHDFGDDYIKTAATVLKKFENYGGIVSRLSGDEFNVCLSGFSSKDEIREVIKEVRAQLLRSYCLLADGTHYKVRGSMGVSWYPDDAQAYELLMKYADFAMYTIKHSTKGGIAEFDMSAYAADSVLLTGVEEMNRIIDECSVQYAFNSIVSAKTGEIYGYEALMRPQSTIFQSPLELLRVAKTGAKLNEMERLTWRRALVDFQIQVDAGRIARDCHIFINSISDSVLEPEDAEAVEAAYPDLLPQIVLEIMESGNVNEEYIARKVRRMKKWNAQIALDDFGTGYNSEYTMITMQPNIIKIDRSIISGCDKDMSRRSLISSFVKLAQTKQILVLAKGVETEGELATVISCGVDLLQGSYFDKAVFEPQPLAPEVTEMIKRLTNPTDVREEAIYI